MMEQRQCGKSGLVLPALGIGCWSFGGNGQDYWGEQDARDEAIVIEAALEHGAVYLDTAEGYNNGRSEEALGRALKGRRAEAIIGSKVSPDNARPDLLREHCEASLRRLGTEYIDLYMVHWPLPEEMVTPAFETLARLREEGKIRFIGLSNFGPQQLRQVAATGVEVASNQVYYNLLSRAIEFEILPECERMGIGVIGYMPLQQGLLTGKYQSLDAVPDVRLRTRHFSGGRALSRHGGPGAEAEVNEILAELHQIAGQVGLPMTRIALSWAAHRPGITCALTGIRTREQLVEAVDGVSVQLSPEVMSRLTTLTETLKNTLGTDADYFQGQVNSRIR
jgi:aryl-alcohol dehydrogenase-like predicted oxidoreductase